MKRLGMRQCCVISGESGAGKTESAKYLIGHIISHCNSQKKSLQEKILQVRFFLTFLFRPSLQKILREHQGPLAYFLDILCVVTELSRALDSSLGVSDQQKQCQFESES